MLPSHKVFDVLGQRAISKELRYRGVDFENLWCVVETSSIAFDDLEVFVFQAECNAGMNLATSTMEEFIVARRKVDECDQCALGYRLIALSACVLSKPLVQAQQQLESLENHKMLETVSSQMYGA